MILSDLLQRLRNHISTKRNFVKASVIGLGCPLAVIAMLWLRKFGPAVPFFGAVLALFGSYVWGHVMWAVRFRDLYARQRLLAEQSERAERLDRQ